MGIKALRSIQTTAAAVLLMSAVPQVLSAADSAAGSRRPADPVAGPRISGVPRFTPEERQKRRQQIKERLARQVSELQKRKAAGTITDEERKRLQRLEILAGRFQRRLDNPISGPVFGSPSNQSVGDKAPKKTK